MKVALNQQVYMGVESNQDRLVQTMTDYCQQVMQLPFDIMRQYLESLMLQQLKIATGIYSKQAKDLDNAFNEHVDRLEATVKTRLSEVTAVYRPTTI